MKREDREAEFKGGNRKRVDELIDRRNAAFGCMLQVKQDLANDLILDESGAFQALKNHLSILMFEYWPKRRMASNFELNSDIEQKVNQEDVEPNADDLNFDECRKLLYSINELMVGLGHTKYEDDKTGRTTV